jgi:hypothetical protein
MTFLEQRPTGSGRPFGEVSDMERPRYPDSDAAN